MLLFQGILALASMFISAIWSPQSILSVLNSNFSLRLLNPSPRISSPTNPLEAPSHQALPLAHAVKSTSVVYSPSISTTVPSSPESPWLQRSSPSGVFYSNLPPTASKRQARSLPASIGITGSAEQELALDEHIIAASSTIKDPIALQVALARLFSITMDCQSDNKDFQAYYGFWDLAERFKYWDDARKATDQRIFEKDVFNHFMEFIEVTVGFALPSWAHSSPTRQKGFEASLPSVECHRSSLGSFGEILLMLTATIGCSILAIVLYSNFKVEEPVIFDPPVQQNAIKFEDQPKDLVVQRQSIAIQTDTVLAEENSLSEEPQELNNDRQDPTSIAVAAEPAECTDWKELLSNLKEEIEGFRASFDFELSMVFNEKSGPRMIVDPSAGVTEGTVGISDMLNGLISEVKSQNHGVDKKVPVSATPLSAVANLASVSQSSGVGSPSKAPIFCATSTPAPSTQRQAVSSDSRAPELLVSSSSKFMRNSISLLLTTVEDVASAESQAGESPADSASSFTSVEVGKVKADLNDPFMTTEILTTSKKKRNKVVLTGDSVQLISCRILGNSRIKVDEPIADSNKINSLCSASEPSDAPTSTSAGIDDKSTTLTSNSVDRETDHISKENPSKKGEIKNQRAKTGAKDKSVEKQSQSESMLSMSCNKFSILSGDSSSDSEATSKVSCTAQPVLAVVDSTMSDTVSPVVEQTASTTTTNKENTILGSGVSTNDSNDNTGASAAMGPSYAEVANRIPLMPLLLPASHDSLALELNLPEIDKKRQAMKDYALRRKMQERRARQLENNGSLEQSPST